MGSELKVLMLRDGSRPYAENASGDILSTFNRAVLGQLLTSSESFELRAGLLKDWKWNPSDGSYDLYLREGLTFHDGSKVSAEDLEFALLKGFFTSQRSFYEIYLGNILGIEKISPETKYRSGLVEGVQITGPLSVRVKLRTPNPSFLYSLTRPYFSFAKREALNEDFVTWKHWPVGVGTYKVIAEDGDKVTLQKRDALAKGIERISLFKKIVQGVDFDISYFSIEALLKLYQSKDPSAIFTLFFTNQNELAANRDFRKAIRVGVNRNSIIEGEEISVPSFEFLPSAFWRNDSSIRAAYDLSQAKEYFAKVPAHLRSKTWRIPVFSFGPLSESKKRITSKLKKQFEEFGFKTDFFPSNEKFLSKEIATESPFSMAGRICNHVDPLLMFSSFKSKSPFKYDNAQNDGAFDELFEKASLAVSTKDRIATLRQLSRYTIEHDFMVPLYEENQVYYINQKNIESMGDQLSVITLALDEVRLK